MSAPKVRADHDALSQIAQRFGAEADKSRQNVTKIKSKLEVLKGGDWVGKGATKFYNEMDSAVLPSLNRLTNALDMAQKVTVRISALMKQAEDDAAKNFRYDAGGGAGGSDGPGGSGGPGGGSGGNGSGGPGGSGGAGGSGGVAKWLKGKGKFFEWGKEDGKKYGKPSFGIKYGVDKDALFYGDAKAADGITSGAYEYGVELSVEGLKKGKVGIFGDFSLGKAQGDMIFAGDKDLGFTGAGEIKAGGVNAFAGVKDGSLGASIGGTLISAKGELGANISGYNVGVNAEVGLKAELGLQIGKNTKIKLPFVTLGFSFGSARE